MQDLLPGNNNNDQMTLIDAAQEVLGPKSAAPKNFFLACIRTILVSYLVQGKIIVGPI